MWQIPIYSRQLPKKQRIFDVEADEKGVIHRYLTQNQNVVEPFSVKNREIEF